MFMYVYEVPYVVVHNGTTAKRGIVHFVFISV